MRAKAPPAAAAIAGIVRRRIEAQVEIIGAAGEAVRMNGEGGEFGRLPAAIVIDDLQKRRAVAARHPVDGGRLREHVGAVAAHDDEGPLRGGELHADRRAAAPAERAAAAGEHRARLFARHMIADRRIVGDAFIEHDRLEPDLTAHAGGQIFRRDDVAARRLEARELGFPLSMSLGVMAAATFSGFVVDLDAVEASVQLRERGRRVGPITLSRLDGPERRRLLERIDVDDGDRGPFARLADGRNPRHVAVDDENEIGLRQSAVLERMVPLVALVQRIVMRKVDVARHGFQHARRRADRRSGRARSRRRDCGRR